MVEYTPPPQDLSRLNPIQRYLQKGSLEFTDWLRLGAIILAYWLLRPYIMRVAKKWSGPEFQEGEEEQTAYQQRRAQAAISDDIRSGKKKPEGKTLGKLLDEGTDAFVEAETSGANVSTNVQGDTQAGEVKNRKTKKSKGVTFAPEKSEVEKMLDWEDESEFDPRKKPSSTEEGPGADSGDIKQWMDKWTS